MVSNLINLGLNVQVKLNFVILKRHVAAYLGRVGILNVLTIKRKTYLKNPLAVSKFDLYPNVKVKSNVAKVRDLYHPFWTRKAF